MSIKDFFANASTAGGDEPSEASTAGGSAAAGAQASEGRRSGRAPGAKSGGEHVAVNLRLRRPIVDAIERAVADSPIEFASTSEFCRRAIEHELVRRGMVKAYK